MKTYTKAQLDELRPDFLIWLDTNWCECKTPERQKEIQEDYGEDAKPCMCYGRDEYNEVEKLVIDDDGTVTIFYGTRQLILPPAGDQSVVDQFNDDTLPLGNCRFEGEPFIRDGDLEWSGDDVDYYGPIVYWASETLR